MNMEMFVMWVVVGLMAGWLAGIVMKSGGYGLKGDPILGLVGSIVGSWLFRSLGFSPGAGAFASVVAFIGAAVVIVTQRKFWHARA